jgi:hypothetical protein
MPTNISVIKANGEKELFDLSKVVNSLKRSGAGKRQIKEVVEKLIPQLNDGMKTVDIYSTVFSLLRENEKTKNIAGRYSLKKAIFELGPTGYPFEKFIAGLLQEQGFETKTNQIVQGSCVTHEVDIIAKKGEEELLIEAKFHANQGYKTKIKDALYVWARYLDISNTTQNTPKPWLITNTKITSQVKQYGDCVGMHVVSWNYPNGGSLREMVDNSKLHPITCLNTLETFTRNILLQKGVIFCKDVEKEKQIFKNKESFEKVMNEVKYLRG